MLDWTSLPNLHPALVHFPIALLPVALLGDLAGLALPRQEWLGRAAAALYALAAVGALAALQAGERAADSLVGLPAAVQPLIGEHSDWAHYAAWTMIAVAVLRLAVARWELKGARPLARIVLLLGGAAALALLARAADLGGALVYRNAVAVRLPEPAVVSAPAPPPETEPREPAASRLETGEDGTLTWRPLPGDREALGEVLRPAAGFSAAAVSWIEGPVSEEGLALAIAGETLLVLPGTFGDVQVEARLDLSGFEGTVALAHHVGGEGEGGFFTLASDGRASLLDRRQGHLQTLDQKSVQTPARELALAVSAAGRHLKGLLDGRTVVHGHVSPGPDGACGLLLDGKGRIRLLSMTVTPLGS